nr:transposase [Streptomyces sp. 1222.5]
MALVRRRGGDVQRGRPWRLPLEDRVLLVATYWRTNLTLRQVAPLFGVSKSAADRILDHLAPLLAISPARRPRKDTVYIVDGTLVPTRDRTIAASSKNYRYSTNLQVVVDANSRLVVAIGLPLPGSRNDCRAFTESGVDRACRGAPTIADGGYQGTGLLIPHRKRRGKENLRPQQEAENAVHRRARARVEPALSRLKNSVVRGTRGPLGSTAAGASGLAASTLVQELGHPIRGLGPGVIGGGDQRRAGDVPFPAVQPVGVPVPRRF